MREHDTGWRELDDDIVFDDENGRALDFVNALPLRMRGRRLADWRYASVEALRSALDPAPGECLIGRARGQDACA